MQRGPFFSCTVISKGLPPTVVSLLDQSGSSFSPFDEDKLEYLQYRQSVMVRPLQGQCACLAASPFDDDEKLLSIPGVGPESSSLSMLKFRSN